MNRLMLIMAATSSFITMAAPSFAGDPTNHPTMTQKHQMMKDCMAKQKAANSGMSKEDMKKACKDQVKSQMDNSDSMSNPPSK
jgi:hypothetical protein